MKERPILFSGPMVRAILEGRKTQTRRVVKEATFKATKQGRLMHEGEAAAWCPYGQPGDRLWVREAWSKALHGCGVELLERWEPGKEGPFGVGAIYAATPHPDYKPGKWLPSIHMPRWASRINLEVTGVRVERLQEISEEDARAEGVEYLFSDELIRQGPEFAEEVRSYKNYLWHGDFGQYGMGNKQSDNWAHQYSNYKEARGSFSSLWALINGPESWVSNPWVWVVEFRKI